jgi:ribose transport system ATP-binding protein
MMTPHLAKEVGIEVIYQEFNLVDSLSAAENICLGEKKAGLVDFRKMESKALEIFKKFNVYIDPKMAVEDLSSAQKQIVEIAKAISRNAKILIMDEPSAPTDCIRSGVHVRDGKDLEETWGHHSLYLPQAG